MIIEPINLVRLRNSEHLSLVQKLKSTSERHIEALPELEPSIIKLDDLVAKEVQTYGMMSTSAFTEQKAKADLLRGNAARFMQFTVRAYEFSENQKEVEAARTLGELLRDVPTIIEKAMATKTTDLFTLTARLNEEPYIGAMEFLKVEPLAQRIEDRNIAFTNLVEQQTEVDSARDSRNMSVVRKPVDVEMRRIFRIIENRFDIDTATDDVKICVRELNYDIREAHNKMKQRLGRGKKGNEQENLEENDVV